jgi:hypothetical protein
MRTALITLAFLSVLARTVQAQQIPEHGAGLVGRAAQDRLVVFESFMRPT